MVMAFNTTFNNIPVISWRLLLLLEETGVPTKKLANHWQTLLYKVIATKIDFQEMYGNQIHSTQYLMCCYIFAEIQTIKFMFVLTSVEWYTQVVGALNIMVPL